MNSEYSYGGGSAVMNLHNGIQAQPSLTPHAMTVEEVCKALHLSKPTVYKLIREDPSFPSFHVGKKILTNPAKLQAWMDNRCRTKEVN